MAGEHDPADHGGGGLPPDADGLHLLRHQEDLLGVQEERGQGAERLEAGQ